ncbi:uncharacterized protein LOC121725626 [Aricia agestis]|uniref:uncharacterized protein LOC121725626 n=1 Tax=Aricia agestis TaxID=91739 RepID=UPI001C206B27|nr:uncharacterized protein LOC121725626 [Aricia agestis]
MMSCSYLNAGGAGGSGAVGGVKPEPCWMPPFTLPDPPRAQFYRPPRPDPTALPVDLAALPANLATTPANLATTSGNLAAGASGNLAASLPASVPALDLSTSLKPPPSSDEESE